MSDMACHDLQVMKEVLEALTESVQKQQRAKDEVQERFHEEAAQPGCQKQRRKDLTERLQVEDAKLQKKQQNLRKAQSLQESWQGERSFPLHRHSLYGARGTGTALCHALHGMRKVTAESPASAALQAPAGIDWLF